MLAELVFANAALAMLAFAKLVFANVGVPRLALEYKPLANMALACFVLGIVISGFRFWRIGKETRRNQAS